ncbi:MAG: prepilin-type N-terminal cleavage/methylation domain-containing protein [Patescibacteria group bacterium]
MNQRGQTLIEVIIAVSIMLIGIISIVSLSITSRMISTISSQELLAAHLAREGVEVIRNIRDSNWLQRQSDGTTSWDAELYSGTDYTAVAIFKYTGTSPVGGQWTLNWTPNSTSHAMTKIYLNIGHIYTSYTGATPEVTPYRRLITLNPICSDGSIITSSTCTASGLTKVGIQVISRVEWSDREKKHNKTAEERIYDWKNY